MNRILVTGGAGFIGSHLVDRLVAEGREVTVLDNFDPQVHQGKKPNYLNKDARYLEGDVRDEKILEMALKEVNAIFHFAAKVGVAQSMYELRDYIDTNVLGTAAIWEYIIRHNMDIQKFIVASSMSIYGEGEYNCSKCGIVSPCLRNDKELQKRKWDPTCPNCSSSLEPKPTRETKKLASTSIYAITKKAQEEISLNMGLSYKIPTVALRFFNVYGPRQSLSNPYTGACAIFSSRIKNGRPPLVYEDGLQRRDFIDVRDIVESCILVMDDGKADYESLNVGTARGITIKDVATILIGLYGRDESPMITNRYRIGDVRHCYADIAKIKKIGFKPIVKLEEGLKTLVEWGRSTEAMDKTDEADLELERRNLKL